MTSLGRRQFASLGIGAFFFRSRQSQQPFNRDSFEVSREAKRTHHLIYKKRGRYVAFPVVQKLSGGVLAVGAFNSSFKDHYGFEDWVVLVSGDGGRSWANSREPSIVHNWPGTNPRERADRFTSVLPDGSYLASGITTWEEWPVSRKEEALKRKLTVGAHPSGREDLIAVGGHKVFVQRSQDSGKNWKRQEWKVAGVPALMGFPRSAVLHDGVILCPARVKSGDKYINLIWRGTELGKRWRLLPMTADVNDSTGGEMAFVEVAPGRILALSRASDEVGSDSGLLQHWSDDSGKSWSHPLETGIKGFPPHLLRLSDGRVLCTYGYRFDPMGIRACFSYDQGETWDLSGETILRDDGGTPSELRKGNNGAGDLGYPQTVETENGTLVTVYYITGKDGITHAACTRWRA